MRKDGLASDLDRPPTLGAVLDREFARIVDAGPWSAAVRFEVSEDGERLVSSGSWRFADGASFPAIVGATQGLEFEPGEGLPGEAWSSGEAITVDVEAQPTRMGRASAIREDGLRSVAAVPIHLGDEVVAVVELYIPSPAEEVGLHDEVDALEIELAQLADRSRDGVTGSRRAQAILDKFEDPFVTLDEDWRYTFLNTAAVETLPEGVSREDALEETIWDLYPGLAGTEAEDALRQAMENREPVTVEEHVPSVDEWWETRIYPHEGGLTVVQEEITERKRAEEELASQRENLELAEEVARMGHWEWRVAEDEVTWSENEFELYGRDPESFEPSFESYLACVHPDDRERVQAELEEALETAEPFAFENRVPHDDGEVRVIRSEGLVETDADGAPIRMFGTSIDVTEQREREEELARQRADLELAEEIGGLGHWVWDLGTDEIDWSEGCYRVFGQDPATFDPDFEAFVECLHPGDRERVPEEVQAAIETGEGFESTYRVVTPDDEIRTIQAHGRLENDESGDPSRMLGTVLDITEAREREQELDRRRRNLELAEEIGGLGHWQWDLTTDEVTWSSGHYRIYGLDRDTFEPSLEAYKERVHPEDRDRVSQAIERTLDTGEPLSFDHRIRHPDGGVRWMQVQGRVEADEHGQPVRMFGVSKDITEQRRREQELREAKEAAEQASRAKSVFLSNTSHEIRTPMNAVTGMTSLLLDTDLDAEQLEYVRTIRESSDHLLTIINDILDLSKVEAGKLDLQERPVRLRDVVEEAIGLVSQRAADKGIELGYLIQEDVPVGVETDPGRLRQILVNLLGNAVKFTDEGEVRLDVSSAPDGDKLRFDVTDTGMGISEEDQEKLFQSFSQVDPSASRQHTGTGLGLAICHRLTNLMGGGIGVESEPGEGSTFTFTIDAEQAEVEAAPPEDLSPVSLRDQRILVVDDNETNREIVQHYLEAWKTDPVLFEDPAEALNWIQEGHEIDLALLDQQMPGMDGIELARRIQEEHPSEDLPVAILTSMVQDAAAVKEAGVELAAYLSKPIRPSALYEELQAIFEGRESAPDTAEEREVRLLDPEMAERLPMSILVVEDNPVSQKVADRLLEKLGYDADLVGRGSEAIEALQAVPYDVVLMDVQMPGMDGYETTERIRDRLDEDRQPRIIALTAHAGPQAERNAEEAGMDDYVSKPLSAEALVSALERATPTDLDVDARPTDDEQEPSTMSDEPDPGSQPLLDDDKLGDLRRILGDGEEGVDGLIETFVEKAPAILDDLEAAASEPDFDEMEGLAHKMKGEASTLGALRLSHTAKEIELGAKDEAIEAPLQAVESLRAVYEDTIEAFEAEAAGD